MERHQIQKWVFKRRDNIFGRTFDTFYQYLATNTMDKRDTRPWVLFITIYGVYLGFYTESNVEVCYYETEKFRNHHENLFFNCSHLPDLGCLCP